MTDSLEYNPKSCWEIFADAKQRADMDDMAARYLDFLTRCKTERETIEWAEMMALKAGFSEDISSDRYYRILRGKSMLLARRGELPPAEGLRLVGAHADTPRLDLKQRPLYEDCGLGMAKTHYYGGIRKYQWLARPLALHGVVVKTSGEKVSVTLGEDADEPVFVIADLLPHLAQKQNERKVSEAFEAEKLNLLLGHEPKGKAGQERKDRKDGQDGMDCQEGAGGQGGQDGAEGAGAPKSPVKARVLDLLHAKYGIVEEDFYSAELQAVPAGAARFVGLDGALLGGYGHDDRACVFASLEALFNSAPPKHTQMVLLWDREEIGSDGSTGAKSRFFEYGVEDLAKAWSAGEVPPLSRVFHETKAVSADVHAPIDPDFQDLHEKLNASQLGYGPCFSKFTGSRGKYGASEAHAEYVAWFRALLNEAGLPWQMAELGKVDQGGGGTVAKDLAIYCMEIIDFGPSVLSMHSPFEIMSKADLYATALAYKAFLES